MQVKLFRNGEQIKTDKIIIEFADGETLTVTHGHGRQDSLYVSASNETTEMIIRPIVSNEIELRFQQK